MASSQTASKDNSTANDKGLKGSIEGRVYEKLSLLIIAKNGYELSKGNSKFRDFSIGREVGLGRDIKFDDNVFRYTEDDNTNNLIFVQVKHIQRDHQIDSRDLSVEAARAKGNRGGGKSREFNLQKYFISYLSVKEELKSATAEEFRNGKIKYVVIFTNVGLNMTQLINKGFSFNEEEAPDDIVKLFTLQTEEPKDFYQLSNISEDLHKILMKSSDLQRMAREFAQYVVWRNYREKNIMKNNTSPMKHYQVPLARKVLQISNEIKIKYSKNQIEERYCDAQFRDDFLENHEVDSKQELRSAVFEAIREIDESKKCFSDEDLKCFLKAIKWKILPNFGKTEEKEELNLPSEWKTVKEEDITDFLKCLVFVVNQPREDDLQTLYFSLIKDTVLDRHYITSLRKMIDQIENTGPELKVRIEKNLGIHKTANFEKKWISGEEIIKFHDEQMRQIIRSFSVTSMTLIYESWLMQLGKVNESGKMEKCLDIFFSSRAKILCVKTSLMLLSSIKLLQYLNSKKEHAENCRIYTNLDVLKSKENRDIVASSFELERNVLLVIEYRHTVNEQDVEEFYNKLYTIVNAKSNKKIILIIPQGEHNNLLEKLKKDFQAKGNLMLEYDVIDIRDFVPREDPLKKEVIVFQGEDKRVSLSDITGIDNWISYVDSLSKETNGQEVIDGMTLVEILTNDEIAMGSKPPGTSSLEGAYVQMYEEINLETLANKLMSQEDNNNSNDMYIISGICGLSKQDRTDKLIQYLEKGNDNEEFKNCLEKLKNHLQTNSVKNLQVVDDHFKDSNFKERCHIYPKKRIFWICLKRDNNVEKFMLQEIYNPKFYLKRKFKNVIIKKDLKEHLIKANLSEKFIFHCAEDKQDLYISMELNEREIKQFENSCMIRIFALKIDAEADFELSKQKESVHLLEFREKQLFWCDSHGSVQSLLKYINQKQREISLVEEDNIIKKMKDKKIVIIADDPGMGKTTTLTKLYETECESSSIIKSHWVILIQLREKLKDIRDLELEKDDIDIAGVVSFLSKIDLKLNYKLAKILLTMALDNNNPFPKSLLLAFDGFDEMLGDKDRKKIISLLKYLKDETAAKIWITTRLHYKQILQKELSNISIEFMPLDDTQKNHYIKSHLQHRLYLTLNEEKYTELFDNNDKKQGNKIIQMYIETFLNKMKLIFASDMARFIGTPLQLSLMLEGSASHFKNWLENGDDEIPVFNYLGDDVYELYENFIEKKYDVYFQKTGIRESNQQKYVKNKFHQDHQHFAVSNIPEINSSNDLVKYKNIFLLVGIIKSQENGLEFIHKTFEEFFASKVFSLWINKVPEANKQEYLLKEILMKPEYQLIRTFMNFQLSEKATKDKNQNELDKSLEQYGNLAKKLLNQKKSFLIDKYGTPLHIAVNERNKGIARFLLNSLKRHSDAQRKLLFSVGEFRTENGVQCMGTVLHLTCRRNDVEIVRVLLDAAEGISEVALQEFLKCLDYIDRNALVVTAADSDNAEILMELLCRANNKLDLILDGESALREACYRGKEEFVDVLLQEFKHEKHSLIRLLLYSNCLMGNSQSELKRFPLNEREHGNALFYTSSTTVIEKLISAAQSLKDNNETLKNMLLPKEGELPLKGAISRGGKEVVEKLLNVSREIEDDNYILKQLLLDERYGNSVLHVATKNGHVDIIKLLLETAFLLGIDILEKVITAVNKNGKNAIQLMVENRLEHTFAYFFKMLEEDKYQTIREKVKEMIDNVPLESRLYPVKEDLLKAIQHDDIKSVKDILNGVKNSIVSPNESLRILLSADDEWERSTLHIACERENSEMLKELLSYAMNIDDGCATFQELLTKTYNSLSRYSTFKLEYTSTSEFKQTVESLIFEAKNSNRMLEATILKEFKEQLTDDGLDTHLRIFFSRRIRSLFKKIKH